MGYKFKPNKGVAKRFKATGTGKLKRRHQFSTHLRSGRSANMKRRLGRPAILGEGHSRNMRRFMGISGTKPNRIAHERALLAKASTTKNPKQRSSAS